METLLEIFSFILGLLTNAYHGIRDRFDPKYKAWGRERKIGKITNRGLLFSRNRKLSRRASYEGLFICGSTGCGKTTRLIHKICTSTKNCSLIINDGSQEIFNTFSAHLQKRRHVLVLNFADSSRSSTYNMLSAVKKKSDIMRIADILVRAHLEKGGKSDPFWPLMAKKCLSLMMRIVLHRPAEFHTMPNVAQALKLFSTHPQTTDLFVAESHDPELIMDYKEFIAMPERTLSNVVASASICLEIFLDEDVAKVCSDNEIQLENFRNDEIVLFLHTSIKDVEYFKVLNEIFLSQLYGYLLEKLPLKNQKDVFVILEELGTTLIPSLSVYLSNCRKFRVGNVLACQSVSQIQSLYSDDAANIIAQCRTRVYFPGQADLVTLREIQELGGMTTVKDADGHQTREHLIAAADVRTLKNRTIIINTDQPLIKGRTAPYFKSLKYRYFAWFKAAKIKTGSTEAAPLLLESQLADYESAQ